MRGTPSHQIGAVWAVECIPCAAARALRVASVHKPGRGASSHTPTLSTWECGAREQAWWRCCQPSRSTSTGSKHQARLCVLMQRHKGHLSEGVHGGLTPIRSSSVGFCGVADTWRPPGRELSIDAHARAGGRTRAMQEAPRVRPCKISVLSQCGCNVCGRTTVPSQCCH